MVEVLEFVVAGDHDHRHRQGAQNAVRGAAEEDGPALWQAGWIRSTGPRRLPSPGGPRLLRCCARGRRRLPSSPPRWTSGRSLGTGAAVRRQGAWPHTPGLRPAASAAIAAVERQKRHHPQRDLPVRRHAEGEIEQLLGAGPGSEPAADPGQGLLAVVAVGCQGHRNGGGVEQRAGHRPDGEPFEEPGAGCADDEHVRAQFLGRLDQRVRVGIIAADVGLAPGHSAGPAPGPGRATPGPAR